MAVLEHKSDNEAVRESIERIFPQLKEPEDERIRKALIRAINNICDYDKGLVTFNGFSKEQVLTWLEKQGEQKPADKCEGCNNAKGCVACVDGSEWAHIEEQKPAWSEEDEEMLRRCISATFDHGYLRECDWLKSFKDRVQPQPNQEWSEEDEYNFAFIQEALLGLDGDDSYREKCCKMAEWLESLKERYTWKPTKNQIDALFAAVYLKALRNTLEKNSVKQLEELYNQLKKLREE